MSKRQQVAFNFFATLAVVSCLAATGHACLASKPAKTSQHAQLQHEELQTGQQHHQQRALQAALGDAASVRALLSSTQQHTVAGTHPSAEQGSQRMLAAGGSKGQRHSGVAVVNDIPGHFEVLAGVLWVLAALKVTPDVVYTGNPAYPATWGLWEWLGASQLSAKGKLNSKVLEPRKLGAQADRASSMTAADGQDPAEQLPSALSTAAVAGRDTAHWIPLRTANATGGFRLHAPLLICISPELAPAVCRAAVETSHPSLLVMWVHRADTATPTSKILSLHSRYRLIALAPHVANLSHTRMRQPVDWALPVAPYTPLPAPAGQDPGKGVTPGAPLPPELAWQACHQRSCLQGFAIQGALRKYRSKAAAGYTRNYTALWARLAELKEQHQAQKGGSTTVPVRVTVLGKGLKHELGIPPTLDADVDHYSRVPYQEFWGRIHRSLALVPSFGMPVYYESRISSTITASLVTCTPLIAEQRLLDTYTFLTPRHVFLRGPDEDEAAAMYRIASMPDSEIMSRRKALEELREELNQRSAEKFGEWLKAAELPGR